MPPVKKLNSVHWVQDDLHTLFTAQLLTTTDRIILEHQSHSMMLHVRALTLIVNRVNSIPDNWNKDEIEGKTCSRQQSWSGCYEHLGTGMGGCSPSMHLLFNLGDCFLYLKLNSHIGSWLFPTIFLHQKSKHLEFLIY